MASPAKKVLLVSSCGGHWVQLNRLLPAFEGADLYFASTEKDYMLTYPAGRYHYIPDASLANRVFALLWQALRALWVLLTRRPQVVVTTGAAPGFFALLFAKKLGKKTIWIDSIANVHTLSLSGREAAKHADLFITQWEHLADEAGPKYFGSVV